MNYILFDSDIRDQLLPFTHTRPIADIRCGILTMRDRWEHILTTTTSTLSAPYLQNVFPLNTVADNLYINGAVFATQELTNAITALQSGEALVKDDVLLAIRTGVVDTFNNLAGSQKSAKTFDGELKMLSNPWDIFSLNDYAIRADYELLTNGRNSQPVPQGVMVSGTNIFIEEGAKIYPGCIINAAEGPVYIGKDTEILEGSLIRGPLALCEHAVIKMGAKIYGATTIGKGCKVGGEISNVVLFANSNKGHDGYLGNAVIGEWCNLGADTNCSNLKNNYDEVSVWSEKENKLVKTGLTFCGLLMGDHSKCAINTMFNTGTVVSVSSNIFGSGFPGKFVPSFAWGGSDKMITYDFSKSMDTANRMMARRKKQLSPEEVEMYRYIYENASTRGKSTNK